MSCLMLPPTAAVAVVSHMALTALPPVGNKTVNYTITILIIEFWLNVANFDRNTQAVLQIVRF